VGFSRREFSELGFGLGVPATYGMKVGLRSHWATRRWKPRDPRFIGFDALPVYDGQTDTPLTAKSCSCMAECDKETFRLIGIDSRQRILTNLKIQQIFTNM